jgi:hypothetical protein
MHYGQHHSVFAKVSTNPEQYHINIPAMPAQGNQPAWPLAVINDGPCFLKAIICDTYAYTATNLALARWNLANLRDHIKTIPEYEAIKMKCQKEEEEQEEAAKNWKLVANSSVKLSAALDKFSTAFVSKIASKLDEKFGDLVRYLRGWLIVCF